jgi:hypothetical protein
VLPRHSDQRLPTLLAGQTAGIYKVEKDALTPCAGHEGKRPKGSTLEDKSGEYLMTFKRVKPRP